LVTPFAFGSLRAAPGAACAQLLGVRGEKNSRSAFAYIIIVTFTQQSMALTTCAS